MKYAIPRYLGMASVKKVTTDQIALEFGYSSTTRRSVTVDQKGMSLLSECLTPQTAESLSSATGLKKTEITRTLRSLEKARLLTPVPKIPEKMKRYDRHLLFYGLQGADPIETQKRISNATVALVGMGGIGSWVSLGLIGAGFKELRLLDFDTVELSNLTRQVLFTEKDLGKTKTGVAGERLSERNSQTRVRPIHLQVKGVKDLRKHLRGVDFLILSADRPEKIHDWVDEVCVEFEIPYINLGYRDGMGVVGPMTIPGETSCYQCHKPHPSAQKPEVRSIDETKEIYNKFDARYQAPSFGPLNSWVSSVGVMEVIKYISGFGECQSIGTELELDPLNLEITPTEYARDPKCWHCSEKA